MSIDRARAHLERYGLAERIIQTDQSSATVAEAAAALGTDPAHIAKSLSFLVGGSPVVVVAAGDARIDNAAFKARFGTKARMIPPGEVEALIGYAVGGVCPFGVEPGVVVHLDESLRRFETVYPACGTSASAIPLTLRELEEASGYESWVAVTSY
jgi:prolyl-tRNA editing enzyme YbaK/EbsC (Cys-tRNA(Pro) deacylase)